MSKYPHPAVHSDGNQAFFKNLALQMADDAPQASSWALHRRVSAGFEIASRLPQDCHQVICDKFCSMIAKIAVAGGAMGDERSNFPAKAYAALKSISSLPDDCPFHHLLSRNRDFLATVAAMEHCFTVAAGDQKTNL
jgi:hypothetical protein